MKTRTAYALPTTRAATPRPARRPRLGAASGADHSRCSGSAGSGRERRQQGSANESAQHGAPRRAFLGRRLEALVDAQLSIIGAVGGDRVLDVDVDRRIHRFQLVQHLCGTVLPLEPHYHQL